MSGIALLEELKNKNMFSSCLSVDEYMDKLRVRYARIFGEILPRDYDYVVEKLKERGMV